MLEFYSDINIQFIIRHDDAYHLGKGNTHFLACTAALSTEQVHERTGYIVSI